MLILQYDFMVTCVAYFFAIEYGLSAVPAPVIPTLTKSRLTSTTGRTRAEEVHVPPFVQYKAWLYK